MKTWSMPVNPVRKIGLAGAGTMGRCMLERMIESGYSVYVYDTYQPSMEKAAELGGHVVSSPSELAKSSDVILLSLPGPAQIEEVVYGDMGIIEGLQAGKVVIDTSTVDPATSKKTSTGVEDLGAAYLDSPILGRPSAIGKWMLPIGGNKEAVAYVEPVLLTFASKVIPTGDHGSGNALKLLNQMMYSAINAISTEVMAIADKVGVDKRLFYETVAGSSAATVSGLFREVGKKIIEDDYDHPVFTVDLLIKDTKLALQMSKDADAPSMIAGYVQIYNELASANGLGSKDVSALYKIYDRNYNKEEIN